MKVFEWHSELAERLRLKLGWSHYAIYWVSFIKGVAVTSLVCWLVDTKPFAGHCMKCQSGYDNHGDSL
jgi:hypothetical protein